MYILNRLDLVFIRYKKTYLVFLFESTVYLGDILTLKL